VGEDAEVVVVAADGTRWQWWWLKLREVLLANCYPVVVCVFVSEGKSEIKFGISWLILGL